MLLQQIAKDVPAEKLQIVSYHPGGIFTELAEHAGFNRDDPRWDDGKLHVSFCISTISTCSFLIAMQRIYLANLLFGLPRRRPASYMAGSSGLSGT